MEGRGREKTYICNKVVVFLLKNEKRVSDHLLDGSQSLSN